MSTKIYEAYRFPRTKLDEFIQLFNDYCFDEVAEVAMAVVVQDQTRNLTRKQLFGPQWRSRKINREYADCEIDLIWTLATAMMMSKTGRNYFLHLDCSFNLWLKGKYAYVIPYVSNCVKLPKVMPKWCEEYVYWDNSDKPVGLTNRQWKQREAIWEALALEDWDRTRLTHVTLEMKMPHQTGLQTLLKRMRDDDKWREYIYLGMNSLFYKMEEEQEAKRDKRTLRAP